MQFRPTTLLPDFTNGEVIRALAQVMPAREIEEMKRELRPDPDAQCRMFVTDGMLLSLAALSEDCAERVRRDRPDLKARVEQVRADPEAFLASARPMDPQ